MASRNGYTVTPSYGGSHRPAQPRIQYPQAHPGDPRRAVAQSSQQYTKNANDTFLLAMLFIVAPVCGLLGLPFLLFRWVFIALSAFLVVTIWVTKRFMFQGRAFLSGILVVAAVMSLISAVDARGAAPQNLSLYSAAGGQSLGAYNPALSGGAQQPAAMPTNPIDTLAAVDAQPEDTQSDAMKTAAQEVLDTSAAQTSQRMVSEAEIALDNYLKSWSNEDFEGMVQYTLPSWRNSARVPPRELSYQHNNYSLNSWEITSEGLSSAINSATYTVIVNITKKSNSRETVYGKYSAIVFHNENDGTWYVDPNSMRTMLKYEPPQVQDSYTDAVAQVDAAPTPEPTVNPKMTLFYNSDGGKFYHADGQCSTVDPKYYSKMKSFSFADINKSGYAKLKPCTKCGAPK